MLGPLAGGALTGAWGWPAVFWFHAPIAAVALLLPRGAPAPPRQAADRFDILGGAAPIFGLVAMLLAINRLRDFSALWLALLSAAGFAAFILREQRARRPIIEINVLRQPRFALLSLVSVLTNLAAFSVWLLVPYFLARVPAYTPTEGGMVLATAAAGAVLAASIGGRLAGRHVSSQRLAIAAAVVTGGGLLLIGAWTEQTPTILQVAGLATQGVGLGLFQLAYSDIVTPHFPSGIAASPAASCC